jgi:hypothetical protein
VAEVPAGEHEGLGRRAAGGDRWQRPGREQRRGWPDEGDGGHQLSDVVGGRVVSVRVDPDRAGLADSSSPTATGGKS